MLWCANLKANDNETDTRFIRVGKNAAGYGLR